MAGVMTSSPMQISSLNYTRSLQKLFCGSTFSSRISTCTNLNHSRRAAAIARAQARQNVADSFVTLGISPGTSKQEIKSAYRRLARQFHPDVCKGDNCDHKFKQIRTAYELAMNAAASSFGNFVDDSISVISFEGVMGVNDDSWEDWEEWAGKVQG